MVTFALLGGSFGPIYFDESMTYHAVNRTSKKNVANEKLKGLKKLGPSSTANDGYDASDHPQDRPYDVPTAK
jgi:hypothetical protein